MTSTRPSGRARVTLGLLAALAGPAWGCAHDDGHEQARIERQPASLAELEAWAGLAPDRGDPATGPRVAADLGRDGVSRRRAGAGSSETEARPKLGPEPQPEHAPERWEPLDESRLVALEQLVGLLLDAAADAQLVGEPRRRALALAAHVGVELRELTLEVDGRELSLWLIHEPLDDRRGRGTYLIRLGPSPRGQVELLLQTPHSRFDRKTGAIGLRLLIEGGPAAPRALFLNSVHRYRQLDGTREPEPEPEANPADAAHNPDHPLARVTAAALAARELVVVQLHGFRRRPELDPPALSLRRAGVQATVQGPAGAPLGDPLGDPAMIISSGRPQPDRASASAQARLQRALPELRCEHHGVETQRLGALANVQGRAAHRVGRCFVHVELDEPLRERLLADPGLRRRFAAALFEGASEEARGGCP